MMRMNTLNHRSLTRWVFGLAALMALGVMLLVPGSVQGHHRADHEHGPRAGSEVPDEYIVMLTRGASADAVQRAHDVRSPKSYNAAFNGFAGHIPAGRLRALQNDPRVEAVIPDRTMQGNPGRPGKANKTTTTSNSEIVPEGVRRIGAAPTASLGVTGAGVGVAVLDSGVDLRHTDLNVSAVCFDAFGGDCHDDSGHGTHVSGVIAAKKNGVGVVGAAPGATIYAVKVLDQDTGGNDSHLLAGIDWVLTNAEQVSPAIRVANFSLGRPGSVDDNPALLASIQALIDAGIVVVVAAGNDPEVSSNDRVPAGFPQVITVASSTAITGKNDCTATNSAVAVDTLSLFSSYAARQGEMGVDITAPGERSENVGSSCIVDGTGILSLYPGDSLAEMAGTSMAAPLVSAVAALLIERSPSLSVEAIVEAITTGASNVSTTPLPSVVDATPLVGGILSAPGALAAIQ
jgi:subtilisin